VAKIAVDEETLAQALTTAKTLRNQIDILITLLQKLIEDK